MSEIFSKTAKGQEEIKTRAAGLSQRMRQVLIFVDGKRSRDDFHGMLKGDDMDDMLRTLIEQGFIEVTGTAENSMPKETAPAANAAPQAAAAKPAAPKVASGGPNVTPEELEKRRLEQEHADELAMARSFLGKM